MAKTFQGILDPDFINVYSKIVREKNLKIGSGLGINTWIRISNSAFYVYKESNHDGQGIINIYTKNIWIVVKKNWNKADKFVFIHFCLD